MMLLPGITDFLADYCQKGQRYNMQILTNFRLFLENKIGLDEFENVERIHVKKYLTELNKKKFRRSTKLKKYQVINLYLEFLNEYNFIKERLKIRKPPNFTDHISDRVLNQLSKRLPQKGDLIALLQHSKKVNETMFILMSILFHNGMRISECISIKLENINLAERMIVTGLVESASKEGICYYFIPVKLVSSLRMYIEELRRYYNNPVYLFPGKTQTGFLSMQNASRNIKKYHDILLTLGKINTCKVNPHSFRKALNHERLKAGCNDSLMAILLNQVPKGTNAQYYLSEIRNDPYSRRDYWDKFTPEYL